MIDFSIIGDTVTFLTEGDLRILNIILVEHLAKLIDRGINLNPDDRPTKEEVIKCLQEIEQNDFADILKEDQGKNIINENGCFRETFLLKS